MEICLTIFYTLVFCFLIYRLHFFEIPFLSKKFIIGIFLIKVLAAIAFGIVQMKFYSGVDTFVYLNDSKSIYQILFIHPLHFLEFLFGPSSTGSIHFGTDPMIYYYRDKFQIIYWGEGYQSEYMVIRFLTVFNLFTFAYYNADCVWMAFLSLIGGLYIYRLFVTVFPQKYFLFIVAIFGIPLVIYFNSGIHKEALATFFLGLLLWNFHQIAEGKIQAKRIITVLLASYLLFVLRDFVLVFLLPNLLAYYWCIQNRKRILLKFMVIHSLYWLVAFNMGVVSPKYDLLRQIKLKQEDFADLKGNSDVQLPPSSPTLFSLIKNSPQTIKNTLFWQFFYKPKNSFQLLGAFQDGLIIAVFFICIFWNNLNKQPIHPLLPFLFLFSISLLVLLGLIVPNLGALARYKSNILPFLLAAFFMIVDEKRLLTAFENTLRIKHS